MAYADIPEAKQIGNVSKEVIHELLFGTRQEVYAAASRKVATTIEELTAQVEIFVLEATEDHIHISMSDDYHGQMLRSIRAGLSGLSKSEPDDINMEQFWSNYSALDDKGKQLVSATARALSGTAPAIKATG